MQVTLKTEVCRVEITSHKVILLICFIEEG